MKLQYWHVIAIFSLIANAAASEVNSVQQNLADAILCKSKPAEAVFDLVNKGNNFNSGYAAYGFGDGTGYKAVAILKEPIKLYGATTFAVVSESEHSYFNFSAFTYGKFKGDYTSVVKALKLQPTQSFTYESLGKFVSQQPESNHCPATIALTPMEDGYFLLGCGWCNGG